MHQSGGDVMASSSATRKAESAQQAKVPGQRGQDAPDRQVTGMSGMPAPGFRLPGGTAGNVLWWGGLAALAALEIVDWPVAAVVAAGTWIAEQHVKRSMRARAAE
jgi:hypothetical protein